MLVDDLQRELGLPLESAELKKMDGESVPENSALRTI